MEKLTFSMEHYLEAVYQLSLAGGGGGARVSDIALRLQVSKASVNNAMNVLAAKGLVNNEKYRQIHLTPAGFHLARSTFQKHRILQALLTQVMGVGADVARADACAMEHVISTESTERILSFLEAQGISLSACEGAGREANDEAFPPLPPVSLPKSL